MAEARLTLPADRAERYATVAEQIAAVVAGESSRTARFATAACLLAHAFRPRFFWTGIFQGDLRKFRKAMPKATNINPKSDENQGSEHEGNTWAPPTIQSLGASGRTEV